MRQRAANKNTLVVGVEVEEKVAMAVAVQLGAHLGVDLLAAFQDSEPACASRRRRTRLRRPFGWILLRACARWDRGAGVDEVRPYETTDLPGELCEGSETHLVDEECTKEVY